ncbi:unnamed protein product [Allacma fusca]|uniref:Glycosyl hydrolase family 13 catalytic domain-containing protein n=1 Tax=Allacma fusca TaxID=39272 RepID=A0A8J2KBC3_9HEXA|nr:unnamed protein product [Allacma fusca]
MISLRKQLGRRVLLKIYKKSGLSGPVQKGLPAEEKPLEWWQQSVVYQIYPRSFQDSDGDGVGDINGITSKILYFVRLGIDAIWISPVYESPMKDFGYDISNFTNIDPTFGTLEDFAKMAQEFKNYGIKVIMDMDPKGNDSEGKPIPPNNWVSFWLDTGVYGFRMDAVPHMFEDQRFLDEPENPWRDPEAKPDEHRYYDHIYTISLPGVLDFLADVRRLLDVYTKSDGQVRCMMVEAAVPDDKIMSYYGTKDRPIAHFPFNFHLLGVRPENNAKDVLNLINIWYDLMPEGEWPTFLIGNHDNKRAATRWTENGVDGANMINLILKGTAVTYYGEELDKVLAFTRTPVEGSFDSGYLVLVNLSEDTVTVDASVLNGVPAIGYPIIRSVGYHDSRVIVGGVIYTPESQALNSDKVLAFARIPSQESNATGYVVLVNLSDDQVSVNSGVFTGIPSIGTVHIRSVDFHNGDAVIGGSINLTSVLLGPRDSIVIVFTPTF